MIRFKRMYTESEYRVVEERDKNDRLVRQTWYDAASQKPHRLDGPAVQSFHPVTGAITSEIWIDRFNHGRHRDNNLPAETIIDADTGVKTLEEFYRNGHLHRDDGGPAEIHRDPATGNVTLLAYRFEGALHRDNQMPALQEFDPVSGLLTNQEFYRHGQPEESQKQCTFEGLSDGQQM